MSDNRARRLDAPLSLPPRGVSREIAAAWMGVSATKFDQLVKDGRMPKPKRIDGRRVWDMLKLHQAFDALDEDAEVEANPWDAVA